jgi:hypothetical protein
MRIDQTENELIIRETPGCLWAFALPFVIVGVIFVYGAFGNFTKQSAVPYWLITVAFILGSIGCVVGLRLIHRSPITKVVIDRDSETVAHTTYGVAGRTHAVYHFDEVEEFCLIEDNDGEGESIRSLGMEISGGKTIKISSLENHAENFKHDFVFHINEFMGKQMPDSETVFESENESEDEIS